MLLVNTQLIQRQFLRVGSLCVCNWRSFPKGALPGAIGDMQITQIDSHKHFLCNRSPVSLGNSYHVIILIITMILESQMLL